MTLVVFLAGAVLGVSTVYRVDGVAIDYESVSFASDAEIEELQNALSKAYKGDSTLFLSETDAKKIFKKYPYFRMTGFKIKYPNKVVVSLAEDEEVYAFEKADGGYYILGGNGVVLGERETYANRADEGDNVIVRGVAATGERGGRLSGDNVEAVVGFLSVLSESLGGIRNNVVSVEKTSPASTVTLLSCQTVEGVKLVVENPETLTADKAVALAERYLALADGERLTGELRVATSNDGRIIVGYFPPFAN